MKKPGFTLVELLIIMALIAILASIVILSVRGVKTEANKTKVKTDLKVVHLALEAYYKDHGTYPNPRPETGDWEDILVENVPQIMSSKIYDPFNSQQLYRYSLSSGDSSFNQNPPLAMNLFYQPAWAAGLGDPPPETPANYQQAKYFIIWSTGPNGNESTICTVSPAGSITADENAIWNSNGNLN